MARSFRDLDAPRSHTRLPNRTQGENLSGRPLAVQVVDEPATELEYVRDVVRPFLGPLGVAGMVLIFSVFLLTKQNDLRNRLFRLVGLDQLNMMTQALDDATSRVSRYLLMQFLVNVGFGRSAGRAYT